MTGPTLHTPEPALLAQSLSAWMDGEALPDGMDEKTLLAWMTQDIGAREAWQDWHVAGDILRQGHADAQLATWLPVESAQWMVRMQQALAATSVATEQEDVFAESPEQNRVSTAHKPERFDTTRTPANDGVWRWKLAAGFASVAAVGLLAWNVLVMQPQSGGMALMTQAPSAQGVQATTGVAPAGLPVAALTDTGTTAELPDTHLQELLVAHAQVGGQSLLPELTVASTDME